MDIRLALITGATSGIGTALARLLALKGINLILTGTNQSKLLQLQNDLGKQVSVTTLAVDLADRIERKKLAQLISAHVPDLVINNAGFGLYGDILSYSTERQLSVLNVNGEAVLELTIEATRAMISRGVKGTVLNVASAAAFQLIPGLSVYAAVKNFVVHFSQEMDIETCFSGVRVLVACPGMVETEFAARAGGVKKTQRLSMSAEYVAEAIYSQILKQKPFLIIDWKYRVLTWISKLMPRRWLAKKLRKDILTRIDKDGRR